MSDTNESISLLRNPIAWAAAISVAFMVLLAALGSVSTCNIELFPSGDCPPKWKHIVFARVNEVGDTLAGLAGVFAFIWLIATVLLQATELRAQRREFAEQRIATQDMAKAMAAQARVFEDEHIQRKEKSAEQELNQKIKSLVTNFVEAGLVWKFSNGFINDDWGGSGDEIYITLGEKGELNTTVDEAVLSIRRRLNWLPEHLIDLVHQSKDMRLPEKSEIISELVQEMEVIIGMDGFLSASQRERLSRMRFPEISASLIEIEEASVIWSEKTE